MQDAVTDKAVANPDQHRNLTQPLARRHGGQDYVIRRFGTAHVLQQSHHVGGGEEVHADHVLRPVGNAGDFVDIQRRGIGRQHAAGLTDGIQSGEDILLHVHILEHGLDHQIDLGQRLHVRGAGEKRHALFDLCLGHPALLGAVFIVLAADAQTAFERLFGLLDHGDRDTSVGKAHGNAPAHGPGADHGSPGDVPGLGGRVQPGDLGDFTLAEEGMDQALGLVAEQTPDKDFTLQREAFRQGERQPALHSFEREQRRDLTARTRCDGGLGGFEIPLWHARRGWHTAQSR